jgi:DNA-directed RNA polymerase subunit RPC12/RpoP
MKCIHCGADSKRRDRSAGRCPRCRHRFAFEPATDTNRVTDPQFKAAIARVSGEGQLQFTERELWYEFNRKWMKPGVWRSPYGWLPVLGGAPGLLSALEMLPFHPVYAWAIGIPAGFLAGGLLSGRANEKSPKPPRPPRIPFPTFQQAYLAKWRAAHGDLPALVPPRAAQLAAPPRQVPGDVAAFSFDRAVVTDRWETAAMLVANRFHFEHNCAVLSRDGYPDGIADTVKTMLRRNPNLTVFALHDASPAGCMLPLHLREPAWFPDLSVRIVDVGLRPEHVRQLRTPALHVHAAQLPPRLAEVLPPEDVAWLAAGNVGELAALRPAQVMWAVHQAIAAVAAADASGTSLVAGSSDGGGGFFFIPMGGGGGSDTASTDGFG